jgi:uncharacterized DUF497 family protein
LRFEWDPNKDAANRLKHGIGFDEAATAFRDPRSRTVHDPDHSDDEDRYLTLGFSERGKLMVVWHTDRHGAIRIIGARLPDTRERKGYPSD